MGGRSANARRWVIGVAIAFVVAVAGAVVAEYLVLPGYGSSDAAVKSGTGELRTDLEPLLNRYPELAKATEAKWMSGTFGRGDVPGPSTYWIDAVVTLPAAEVERLVAAYSPAAQGNAPTVVEVLRDHLPPGPFLTGDKFGWLSTDKRMSATVYLDRASNQVVLVATGE